LKEYKVVKGYSTDKLEREVASYIQRGWLPLGGVSVTDNYAFQAMVRRYNRGVE